MKIRAFYNFQVIIQVSEISQRNSKLESSKIFSLPKNCILINHPEAA